MNITFKDFCLLAKAGKQGVVRVADLFYNIFVTDNYVIMRPLVHFQKEGMKRKLMLNNRDSYEIKGNKVLVIIGGCPKNTIPHDLPFAEEIVGEAYLLEFLIPMGLVPSRHSPVLSNSDRGNDFG